MAWVGLEAQAWAGRGGGENFPGSSTAQAGCRGSAPGFGTRLGGKGGLPHIYPDLRCPGQGHQEAWVGDPQSPWDPVGLNSAGRVRQKGPWGSSRLNLRPERRALTAWWLTVSVSSGGALTVGSRTRISLHLQKRGI